MGASADGVDDVDGFRARVRGVDFGVECQMKGNAGVNSDGNAVAVEADDIDSGHDVIDYDAEDAVDADANLDAAAAAQTGCRAVADAADATLAVPDACACATARTCPSPHPHLVLVYVLLLLSMWYVHILNTSTVFHVRGVQDSCLSKLEVEKPESLSSN